MIRATDQKDDVTRQSLPLLLNVARVLSAPVAHLHHDHFAHVSTDLPQDHLRNLSKSPAINTRLNHVIAQEIGVPQLQIVAQTLSDVSTKGDVMNIFALVAAPIEALDGLLRQVTAVRLQNAIRQCVLKADRERVRTTLGDDAYATAMREAPLFYANIIADTDHTLFAADHDSATPILTHGATLVHSYLKALDHGLAKLFAWRLPRDLVAGDIVLNDTQIKSIARLLAAKGPRAGSV